MTRKLNEQFQRLEALNLEIRQRLELAEARVETANGLLAQLAATELVSDQIFLGDVIMQRAYSVRLDPTGSGQVIQAALTIRAGFGAIHWDSEELALLHNTPEFEAEAIDQMTPFDQCGPAIKALLLSQLEPLLDRLLCSLNY